MQYPDKLGLAVVVGIMLTVVAFLYRQIASCSGGWRLYILHVIARVYSPFVFGLRISSRCPIPVSGEALLIANHRSPVDPMMILATNPVRSNGYCIRVVEFLTAKEYTALGGPIGFICDVMRCIPVARDGKDMEPAKEALRRLKQGKVVGVFPEGRINSGEGVLPAIPGMAWLALRAHLPVYPVFIHGAPGLTNMIAPFVTFTKVSVTYGEPIDLSAFYGRRPTQDLLQEVAEVLRSRLAALELQRN